MHFTTIAAALAGTALVTMETMRRIRDEFGVNMTCGASNTSFGMPDRHSLGAAFLPIAMCSGMTSAIMDARNPQIVNAVKAADLLLSEGAAEVHAYITHGVLSGPAVERVSTSAMKSLVITDSIEPTEAVRRAPNIRIVPMAPLLGQAILNIANGTSVSSLFDSATLEPIYEAFYPTRAA